jgi:GNAT superfamily N-acetyltransferase
VTTIRAATPADRDRWLRFLEERGMRYAARLGELHDPASDEAFLAEDRTDALVGLLTYRQDGVDCEVSTLYVVDSWRGVGTALMEAVVDAARHAGCRRLWLVTTNDNVDAMRFYQRRGFRLAELRPGAVDESRATLKPSIPEVGDHGIGIHDEIVLERRLDGDT